MNIDSLLKKSFKANFLSHFLNFAIICNDEKILNHYSFYFELFLKKIEDTDNSNYNFFILIDHKDDTSILKEFNSKYNNYSLTMPFYSPFTLKASFCDDKFYFNIDDLIIGIYDRSSKNVVVIFNKTFLNQGPRIFIKVFTIVLSELLRYKNYFMLHCSSLCYKDKGINFIGASGYGKSTILMSLLEYDDVMYISDDVVIFGKENESFMAYAFTNKVNLLTDTIRKMNLSNQDRKIIPCFQSREDKYFCDISNSYKNKFKYSCPIKYNIFLSNERNNNDIRIVNEPHNTLNLLSDNSNLPFNDDYMIYHINNLNKFYRNSKNYKLFLTNKIKESIDYIYEFIKQLDKS